VVPWPLISSTPAEVDVAPDPVVTVTTAPEASGVVVTEYPAFAARSVTTISVSVLGTWNLIGVLIAVPGAPVLLNTA
jgi:hypothetical protein